MDKMNRYRKIVHDLLTTIAERPYSSDTLVHEALFDEEKGNYVVMTIGWMGPSRRVHHCLMHLEVKNDKIWIQRDGTEDGIAYDLEAAGVPKSDIVLAFRSPEIRQLSGYAVA